MSDVGWYGRLLVWVGAGVIVVEAVAGKSFGMVTPLAVVMISGGFLAFLAALMWGDRPLPALATARTSVHEVEISRAAQDTREEIVVPPEPGPEPSVIDVGEPETVPPASEEVAEIPPPAPPPAEPMRIRTLEVVAGSQQDGVACCKCSHALSNGNLAAVCAVCGSLHHAGCWIDNRFHCAHAGCPGNGSLEAPTTPAVRQ